MGILASGMCCCCGCFCGECADGLKRLLGMEKVTKVLYFFIILVYTIPAIFIFFFLNNWDKFKEYFVDYIYCPGSSGNDRLGCIGMTVVFRLSLALLALFLCMFIIMLFRSRCSMVINEGCFCFKYVIVVGITIAFLWVPNYVFTNYAQFCKYASIVYMILQSIILIDLFYLAGIKLVKEYDKGQSQYACYLVAITLVVEVIAIALNVIGYVQFSSYWNGNTLWVNIVTSIMLIILPCVQLLHFNSQNSLVTTALVSLFIVYLNFIAQYSYSANSLPRMSNGSLAADIVCSTFFFVLTMYGSIMGGTGQMKVTGTGASVNEMAGVAATESAINSDERVKKNEGAGKSSQNVESQQSNQRKYTQSWQWVKWHFYMCIASIYLSMLITNWISIDITTDDITYSNFGFWVRVAVGWITFKLYIWTMIVPKICPNRNFEVN